ncbi:MAG: extensin family protein [Myxococcota bacterium]|nr:extensin family protein [Myxococcota bacterium]
MLLGGVPDSIAQAPDGEPEAILRALRADRPAGVPEGALVSIEYTLEVAARIERAFPTQAAAWRARAVRYLRRARAGVDPYPEERGRIVPRGYRSPLSTVLQGYAVYLPPDYDATRPWPLMVVLHGGSSNGNLFLGVVLGNNLDWEAYPRHLWDEFEPRWRPAWIVVAPTGFGQVMWRWMGERDVLDVIDDVRRHYHVDPDRIVLGGLSNGGVGAYAIGSRHAWRFSAVMAMAGAPSWLQYVGGRPTEAERAAIVAWSGLHLLANTSGTDFRAWHGRVDPGPMRPAFFAEYEAAVRAAGLPARLRWLDAGHDILYLVHRHGRIYDELAAIRRQPSPARVSLVSGDYRAARQHWLEVRRIEPFPGLAEVQAEVNAERIDVRARGATALCVDLRTAPVVGESVVVQVDQQRVLEERRDRLGHQICLVRREGRWTAGFPEETAEAPVKRSGSSGPITDAYYEPMVHVYGTLRAERIDALRRAAERGARGWPLWLWDFRQPVLADHEVDAATMRRANLVLYGTPQDHALIARIAERLPIRVEGDALVAGGRRWTGRDVGARFIYPNPLQPDRYVIVQTGVSPQAVDAGNRLPDFLPDWIVYDARTTAARERLITGRRPALAMGWFDERWRLVESPARGVGDPQSADPTSSDARRAGGDAAPAESLVSPSRGEAVEAVTRCEDGGGCGSSPSVPSGAMPLSVAAAPPLPPAPATVLPPRGDPAHAIAREIARRVVRFPNLRAEAYGGRWVVEPERVWRVRGTRACFAALRAAGIRATPWTDPLSTPVPAPVRMPSKVGAVRFHGRAAADPLVVACELAARLPALSAVLQRHGIEAVAISSAWRPTPWTSFHTFGLALDVPRMWSRTLGLLELERDFVTTPSTPTCEGPAPTEPRAALLREIACDLWQERVFNTVITPNYNEGHRDHFHFDIRPDDPRFFVR